MKAQKNTKKNGGVLLMAMLMVLVFSVLALGLFKLFDTDAVETVSLEHHRRAFWLAEMGLEKAVDRLFIDLDFRNNPDLYLPHTVDYAGGSFANASYEIESVGITPAGTGLVYTVTSRGMAGSINRRIQQTIFAAPGSPHALRSMRGDIYIDSNVYIDGDIFVDVGDVDFASNTDVDGYVVAGGNVTGNGASNVHIIEMPHPPQPNVDMAFWQPFLDDVFTDPNTNGLAGVTNIYITTGVSNYVYYGTPSVISVSPIPMVSGKDLVISGTASGVSNFHYMVSASGILFNNWLRLESGTIVVVDGDVVLDQQPFVEENCIIFATGDITVKQANATAELGVTLIAGGNIDLAQQIKFNGIIFAEGTVDVGSNAEIRGTIIGGDGVNIGSNADITFDPTVFLNPLPGINNVWNQAIFTPWQWQEIAPAP